MVAELRPASAGCARKSASLAAPVHVQRWRSRLADARMAPISRRTGWTHDADRTLARARAVYRWTPPETPLWLRDAEYEPWRAFAVRRALRSPALLTAEDPPDHDW